jgi:hypothetical protein
MPEALKNRIKSTKSVDYSVTGTDSPNMANQRKVDDTNPGLHDIFGRSRHYPPSVQF